MGLHSQQVYCRKALSGPETSQPASACLPFEMTLGPASLVLVSLHYVLALVEVLASSPTLGFVFISSNYVHLFVHAGRYTHMSAGAHGQPGILDCPEARFTYSCELLVDADDLGPLQGW